MCISRFQVGKDDFEFKSVIGEGAHAKVMQVLLFSTLNGLRFLGTRGPWGCEGY